MKNKLALVFTILCGLVAGTIPALAQTNFPNNIGGRFIASDYGKWSVTTLTAITAGTSTVNFAPCFIQVGTSNRQVFPFWQSGAQALNVPIEVLDGSTLSELVSSETAASFPSAAPPSYPQQYICSITATFANSHGAGVTITSGDGGLAEAMNDAISSSERPMRRCRLRRSSRIMALDPHIEKQHIPPSFVLADEPNFLAGAGVYKQHCAVCHGLSGQIPVDYATTMFPKPPQLFCGKGVTDDPTSKTYWKAANGIRLSGMPSFKTSCSDTQLWPG